MAANRRVFGVLAVLALLIGYGTSQAQDDWEVFEKLRNGALSEITRIQAELTAAERELDNEEAALDQKLRDGLSAEQAQARLDALERDLGLLVGHTPSDEAIRSAEELLADRLKVWERSPPSDCRPLKREDIPELDRRVLSLPGARLHEFPGVGPSPAALPTFSVLYVFDTATGTDGTEWLEVSRGASCDNKEGWIAANDIEDWKTMLVMQFAPRGSRERVLFFHRLNDLSGIIELGYADEEANNAYDAIERGNPEREIFTAIEPKTPARFADRPFLMPILDWEYASFIDGTPVTLLEVAGLNADSSAPLRDEIHDENLGDLSPMAAELRDLKTGIKFVIDTTISMGPYIERTYDTVSAIYDALDEASLLDRVAFGLVAYRDNTRPNPRIGYVTRIIQPLNVDDPPARVLGNLRRARPADVPTKDWNEDALAGLQTAIEDSDWEDFDARLLILISDAGARERFDPLARDIAMGLEEIVQMARARSIAIIAIHLQTREAERVGNIAPTRRQYTALTETGDINEDKYIGIPAGDPEYFKAGIDQVADIIVGAAQQFARGRVVRPEPLSEPVAPNDIETRVSSVITNELFRAQLEFLGARRDEAQPRFYRAWAADRDLTKPARLSLEVKAFFTRNQLNTLAQGLSLIIDVAERTQASPQDFFRRIAALSAEMAVEGNRRLRSETAVGDMLPPFLRALPYRSKILKMTLDDWISLGPTGRDQLINELKSKQLTYAEINADDGVWTSLASASQRHDDPGLMVTALPLSLLP